MSSSLPSPPGHDRLDRLLAAQAGHMMRVQARETWLVPLLAVPLARLALAPEYPDRSTRVYTGDDPSVVKGAADKVEARVQSLAEAAEGAELGDEDARLLVEFSSYYRGLLHGFLHPPPVLLGGLGLPPDLRGDPLIRGVAGWVSSSGLPVPLTAVVAAHVLLPAVEGARDYMPRAHSRFAPATRAIDHRMAGAGAASWVDALKLVGRFWNAAGWVSVGVWQQQALDRMIEGEGTAVGEREADEHARQVRQHRGERKRLQAANAAMEEELRELRPLRDALAQLRETVSRHRTREAELVQARDRAQARAAAVEGTVRELETANRALRYKLASFLPPPAPPPGDSEAPAAAPAGDELLPATLLVDRKVFLFTGHVRGDVATKMGESLGVLGAKRVRTICVHKDNLGPETFPAGALVVLDLRFVGHKHSIPIEDRARKSGAEYLPVKSGKGGLARAVTAALERKQADTDPAGALLPPH